VSDFEHYILEEVMLYNLPGVTIPYQTKRTFHGFKTNEGAGGIAAWVTARAQMICLEAHRVFGMRAKPEIPTMDFQYDSVDNGVPILRLGFAIRGRFGTEDEAKAGIYAIIERGKAAVEQLKQEAN